MDRDRYDVAETRLRQEDEEPAAAELIPQVKAFKAAILECKYIEGPLDQQRAELHESQNMIAEQNCNIASTSYHGLPPIVGPKIQPSDPSSPSGWDMVTRWARLGTFLDELETRSAKLQELLQDQLEYALSGIVHKQKSGKEQKSKATEHHESAIQAQGKYEKE
ncbi:hypothetical protein PPACK8108_LOCUS22605 [Phakopsora pachyrhizi]|uniref:Uncharacterized protein n=1 Tax=Phakopsora pachyrhizi TaxID=170000 RepID=A0AAV0BKJ0_PHAPC|nr:hypothetical protein PPACK8108_LOCUS22605 [Phakopsora pachyrhizi]